MNAVSGKLTDLTNDGLTRVDLVRPIPRAANLDVYPRWSPDSKTIRFARQAGNSGAVELASVPVGGCQVSKLGTIRGRLTRLLGLAFLAGGIDGGLQLRSEQPGQWHRPHSAPW